MLDQVKFMETLRSVAEIARVSTSPLSKEEVINYFDMELTEEQQEMVYQYILTPPQEEEEVPAEEESKQEDAQEEEGESKLEGQNSIFLEMYLEDINQVPTLSPSEESAAYIRLIEGEKDVMTAISDHWLTKVVELAKGYAAYPVNIEDLIQEGNIGLLSGLAALCGMRKKIDVAEYLKESVQKAMEDFIDENSTEDDLTSTVIAKTTLITEAKKALEKELGRECTIAELASYTRLTEEEISDILMLSNPEK
ncbi:MAG: hypothetical protein E7256_12580 [Lachnospiraceae bacterium]|nr:hypothetical protein [Lachnospiraceae bacterium]